jgi:hypothetical protein
MTDTPSPTVLDHVRARWPQSTLEYVRLLATTVLALVLVPLALARLFADPIGAADRVLGSAVR